MLFNSKLLGPVRETLQQKILILYLLYLLILYLKGTGNFEIAVSNVLKGFFGQTLMQGL